MRGALLYMRTAKKNSNLKWVLFFLLPSTFGLIIFSVVPILSSFILSLTGWNGLNKLNLADLNGFMSDNFIGAANYTDILTGEEFWRVLKNTSYFIILYVPLILFVSIIVAVLLNNKYKGIAVYRVLYYIPVLTSWVAGALIWKWVLSPDFGILNSLLGFIGIKGPGWIQDSNWAMPGVVLASLWKDMGFFGLIFLGGLQSINPVYYEAAEIDGVSWWNKLTKITLPLVSPYTFFIVIISIINSFQLFPQVMVMLPNGNANFDYMQVMVERIYRYAFRYFKMGYAASFSWMLFLIIFAFTFLQTKLQNRWVHYDT